MSQRAFTILEVVALGALVLFVMYIGGAFKEPEPTPTNEPTRPPATATRPRPTATLRATATPAITGTLPAITSPTGLIAFISNRDGNSEIYVVDVESGVTTNLTNNPAEDSLIGWSPDGSRIAFFSTRTGWLEVYVMSADGSNVVQLTNTFGTNTAYYTASWSPDSTQLVGVRNNAWPSVSHFRYSNFLELIRADGSGVTTLYESDNNFLGNPTWSPDGQYIATTFNGSTSFGVYVGKARETPFSPNPFSGSGSCFSNYAWSPDGELSCPQGGTIYLFDPANSDIKWLDTGISTGHTSSFAWSPNRKHLLFILNSYIRSTVAPEQQIYLASTEDAGSRVLLDATDKGISLLSWSPDSQWFAFSAGRDEQFNIYIVNIYDPNQRIQLTVNLGDNFSPQWQPQRP
jgi:TolB protein